ncbi:sigma intracellular receptor 2-like [Patiria miniata]|uniref:Sigma intracellular receptor 2 n=1 Tax=Patiria miniata TaxID=46514 RepID=A0A914A6Q3_PATMI|nr:sigma intracellular receptor 2-like [Patiria miniata]
MAKGLTRVLEWVIVVYFASHIIITIFFDSQAIMPSWLYPKVFLDLVRDYCIFMKDEMMADPSAYPWFMSFVYGECLLQFPFFFVATYAFYKGSCKWIRIPAIIYSVHTATTLQAIFAHMFFQDFTNSPHPGPVTLEERLKLAAIYCPYFFLPVLILLLMLFSDDYKPAKSPEKPAVSTGTSRSRKHKTR